MVGHNAGYLALLFDRTVCHVQKRTPDSTAPTIPLALLYPAYSSMSEPCDDAIEEYDSERGAAT
jgi:hypothetical protein